MAIKKLQNNYTTLEQSKRLLELGVPVDSADCVHTYLGIKMLPENIVYSQYDWMVADGDHRTPCWSVGRLMEIYDICRCYDEDWDEVYGKETYIETYISAIEEALSDKMFDFSKLEE